MSSKSRKQKPRAQAELQADPISTEEAVQSPAPAATPAEPGGRPPGRVTRFFFNLGMPEDPKKRLKYFLGAVVVVFTLVTFVAPFAIPNMFASDPGAGEWLRFSHPALGTVSYDEREFGKFRQRQQLVMELVNPYFFQFRGEDLDRWTDRDCAGVLIYGAVARAEGVVVSEQDFQVELKGFMSAYGIRDAAAYRARVSGRRGLLSPKSFEETLRELLLVSHYQTLLGRVPILADPEAIEAGFREQHREYSFDYVELEVASFTSAANELSIEDLALEEWFDGVPEARKGAYKEPARTRAEVVGWAVRGAAPVELLTRYPSAEDEALDTLVERYYQEVFTSRFRLPGPIEVDGEQRYYEPLEEVRAEAALEAPIYFALKQWHSELRERMNPGALEEEGAEEPSPEEGQEAASEPPVIDLLAEAAALGLLTTDSEGFRSAEEWRELEGFGSQYLSGPVMYQEVGTLIDRLIISDKGFAIVRALERQESSLPPLAEIREQVLLAWREEQQGELALDALRGLRAGLDPVEEAQEEDAQDADEAAADDQAADDQAADDAATGDEGADELAASGNQAPDAPAPIEAQDFARAAGELGYELHALGWFDPLATRPATNAEQAEDARVLAENDLRSRGGLRVMEEGEFAEAFLDTKRERAYLVYMAGRREGQLEKMTPQQYKSLRSQLKAQAGQDFAVSTVHSGSELLDLYGMYLKSEDPEYLESRRTTEP